MKKLFFITLFIFMGLICTETNGADWKFFGGETIKKGGEKIFFYDTESLDYLSNENIRVWIKAITKAEFDMAAEKNKDQIIKEAGKKIANGYFPPYILVEQINDFDDIVDVVVWEETANRTLSSLMKMFFEINCKEKKLRTLSIIYFKNDGGIESKDESDKWEYISPESNIETIHKILCK
ncbi:MAG: hypothetical protein H8D96_06465 [Desulfobacterales bacterium]|uniref:Surface-adhesin protein E-like domain-containing protein n=1 Tax=Candidatus Desulfatibia vada TaxID=2841696 RepID=A0A8J6P0I7_9BACT|nr:hypothetical protein [Candidatus Desulfatibia vada]